MYIKEGVSHYVVIEGFHLLMSSGRTMVLGSTQRQTEMSASSIFWGVKAAGA
jgi:hypothetical protein